MPRCESFGRYRPAVLLQRHINNRGDGESKAMEQKLGVKKWLPLKKENRRGTN
jgi:hypothetical protein